MLLCKRDSKLFLKLVNFSKFIVSLLRVVISISNSLLFFVNTSNSSSYSAILSFLYCMCSFSNSSIVLRDNSKSSFFLSILSKL